MLDVNDGQKHDRAAILIDRGIRNMSEQPFERSERSVACSSSHFERTSCFEREHGFFVGSSKLRTLCNEALEAPGSSMKPQEATGSPRKPWKLRGCSRNRCLDIVVYLSIDFSLFVYIYIYIYIYVYIYVWVVFASYRRSIAHTIITSA